MLTLLPVAAWILIALAIAQHAAPERRPGPREALLISAAVVAAYLVAVTEATSLLHLFTRAGVIIAWSLPVCVLTPLAWQRRARLKGWLALHPQPDHQTLILTAATVLIIATIGLIALSTPTVIHDCLGYHLPRQFYWIQQASVAHFPNNDIRQLEMPPWVEFGGANLALLSGGWSWSNATSWACLGLVGLAASLLARELGGRPHAQALSAFLAVAVPAAALQGADAKNDVAVAAWLLVLAVFVTRVWSRRRFDLRLAAGAGLSAGLLLLSKGTGSIYALPMALLLAIGAFRIRGWRAVPPGIAAAALALSLNAGHYARNYDVFGSPLGEAEAKANYRLVNRGYSPAHLASNLTRNLALHTGSPSARLNAWLTSGVERLHEVMGVSTTDPLTTSLPEIPYRIVDDTLKGGGNEAPVHLLLAVTLGAILARPGRLARLAAPPIYSAPFVAFLLFSCLLRWQPWHERLQLPAFVLLGAVSGPPLVAFARAWIRIPIAALAGAFLAWATIFNCFKPLTGPHSIFRSSPITLTVSTTVLDDLAQAAPTIAALHPRIVAIELGSMRAEWIALAAARNAAGPDAKVITLNALSNPSAGPGWYRQTPDLILSWSYRTRPIVGFHVATRTWYEPVAALPHGLTLLKPRPQPSRRPTPGAPTNPLPPTR